MVDANGGMKKNCGDGKKNAGNKATTCGARHPGFFWGRKAKQVPGTLVPMCIWGSAT